jgi:hypothetical protein
MKWRATWLENKEYEEGRNGGIGVKMAGPAQAATAALCFAQSDDEAARQQAASGEMASAGGRESNQWRWRNGGQWRA